MKTKIILLIALISSSILFTNCKKDPPKPNEEELITTVIATWTPVTGGDPIVFVWQDLDGDGGNAPVITTAPLQAGITYDISVRFLNESVTPIDEITEEIEAEDDHHQIFYKWTPAGLFMDFVYQDFDHHGKPLGLKARLKAGIPATGTFNVKLLHEPNKSAPGVPDGNPTNAGGDTDVDVTFNVTIN